MNDQREILAFVKKGKGYGYCPASREQENNMLEVL